MSFEPPRAVATIRADGNAEVVIDGVAQRVLATTLEQTRSDIVAHVAALARVEGRPITVDTYDPEGRFLLVVNPDGSLGELTSNDLPEDTIPPASSESEAAPEREPGSSAEAVWGPPGSVPPAVAAAAQAQASPPQAQEPAVETPAPAQPTAPPPYPAQPGPEQAAGVASWMRTAASGGTPAPAPAPTPPMTQPQPAPQQPSPPQAQVPQQPVHEQQASPWTQGQLPQQTGYPQPGQPQPQGTEPGYPGAAVGQPGMTRRQMRESFLKAEQTEPPATKGFRGTLAKVGIRTQPSAAERAEREDIHAVSQHWPGVRTIAVVNGKGGAGKALAVDEPVMTPSGYRAIGDLAVGDEVIGLDGLSYPVLGVYPQGVRDLYDVAFTDGTTIRADGDHIWAVQTPSDRLMTTAQIMAEPLIVERPGHGSQHRFRVPVAAPIKLAPTDVPLDPYRFGQQLCQAAPAHAAMPGIYKNGDLDTRLAVLQGLMDTDGSVSTTGAAGSFTTVSAQLAEDVQHLAQTLGCVVTRSEARVTSYVHAGEKRRGQPAHTLRIYHPAEIQLFRLARKQHAPEWKPQRAPHRAIASITPAGRGEAVCISVGSPDNLFLARNCVPTHNTPTTALLAATFARYSGAATIAWDNNETRGTLGWRTEQGKHEATVLDLIPRVDELLDPSARAGDISHFVHHQADDKYDVLRSNPNLLSSEQRINGENVDSIHDVLGRYYRLIFVDSGNDESADHWLQMIEKADQIVVPTIAKPEHAEAGALLLEALTKRGGRSAELARRAVVIVSQAREKDVNPSAADIARGFEGWVASVVTIPYDRAMVESVLRFDALNATTRRAWLRAAAAVARQL